MSARKAVTGVERRKLQAVYDATGVVLEATNYAEAYLARLTLREALADLLSHRLPGVAPKNDSMTTSQSEGV